MSWTIQKAKEIYNIAHWSNGYFDVNDSGELICRPDPGSGHPGVSLVSLLRELLRHDLSVPVLVRFSGILSHRIKEICAAFDGAMAQDGYQGRYTAIYPIKVNQQRSVVDALFAHGGGRLGIEAGSKPELLAALACAPKGQIAVCNGYKDREFIRLALIGTKLGIPIHIVVEKMSELNLILSESQALQIQPLLGVRVRLSSLGSGKWQNTGGAKSKFGLSAAQVLSVIERLRDEEMLGCLQMMHFHMGSQIANIHDIQAGMKEAARYYAELRDLGAPIRVVDVGGGLGVDYEGTRSRSACSMNYTVQEYAQNIVRSLLEVCEERDLPHPDIVSESGRALTAHHAVLITNIVDVEQPPAVSCPSPPTVDEPPIIQDLWKGLVSVTSRSTLEVYHDAVHRLGQAQAMFHHGVLSLRERARAEDLYFATCRAVREKLHPGTRAHREVLDELSEKLADKYFVNFSLFQSIPDHWAIEQIFPVLPLAHLDQEPTRRVVLQDITCDSDGRIDYYIDGEGLEKSLPLYPLRPGEPYYVGIFMVGAYQEILGDMHNLFGYTDSVHVETTPDGGFCLTQPLRGDTVDTVLRFVHFEAADLLAAYRDRVASAHWLSTETRDAYLEELQSGLTGYTYLED